MESEQKIYSTRDLYLATTLITLKFYMVGVDYQIEPHKDAPVAYFNFNDTPELRDIERKYIQSLLSVEPKQFITNFRSLKAEIKNYYDSPQSNIKRNYNENRGFMSR